MKEYRITDAQGNSAVILPEKGATVISCVLAGQELFCCDRENLESPERPRCGVPFLFPVFGRLPEDSPWPMEIHGFAHTSRWDVTDTADNRLVLTLGDSEATRALFPFAFRVQLTFTMEAGKLTIAQRYENPGAVPLPFAFGFHPYFAAEDPEAVTVQVNAGFTMDMATGKPAPWGQGDARIAYAPGAPEAGGFFLQTVSPARIDPGKGRPICMEFDEHFSRLVLWSLKGRPFLCAEPINHAAGEVIAGKAFCLMPGEALDAKIAFLLT